MSRELNRALLARDTYQAWKRRVQAASESVRVFTPYFDLLVDRLLGNADLDSIALSVVTDLSPASGALDYRGQLLGARALLRRGIEVRSLPRLHAKVLVCDGELVTVGSQNFTSYARGSKETTAVIQENVSDTDFAATLDDWYLQATPVSLEFVERLLDELAEATRLAQQAREDLVIAYDEQWETYLEELKAERQRQLAAAQRKSLAAQLASALRRSKSRQARESVWARLSLTGEWDTYETLLVQNGSSFTWWRTRDTAGALSFTTLTRLSMYPIILNPLGRMAFGRVGETRITYVRDSLQWKLPREILGGRYALTVRLPTENLDFANIRMTLAVAGQPTYSSLELWLRFDGLETILSNWKITTNARASTYARYYIEPQTEQLEALVEELQDADNLESLMSAALATFTYSELGIGNRNADEFFPRGWVKVTLIDYADRPVLVVSTDDT